MRLRNGLSHLQGHKLKHITDCLNQICMCGKDFESTNHFFLQCSLFVKEKQVLMNKIRDNAQHPYHVFFFFCKENMNDSESPHIFNETIGSILSAEMFNILLFE